MEFKRLWLENWWNQTIFSFSLWVLVIIIIWTGTATKPENIIKCQQFYSNNVDVFPKSTTRIVDLLYLMLSKHKKYRLCSHGLTNEFVFIFIPVCCYFLHWAAYFFTYSPKEMELAMQIGTLIVRILFITNFTHWNWTQNK